MTTEIVCHFFVNAFPALFFYFVGFFLLCLFCLFGVVFWFCFFFCKSAGDFSDVF